MAASGAGDGRVRIWDAGSGVPFSVLFVSTETENPVDFGPNSDLVAYGDAKGEVKISSILGTSIQTLSDREGHGIGKIGIVRLSPNGELLADAGSTNWVHLWDTKTWTLRATLKEFTGSYVNDLAFSRDGHLLAIAGSDPTIKLWDADLGALKRTLAGRKGQVSHVAFSSDRLLGSSARLDGNVMLWDPSTGALLGTLQVDSIDVEAIAFSEDGRLLAADGYQAGITLWERR